MGHHSQRSKLRAWLQCTALLLATIAVHTSGPESISPMYTPEGLNDCTGFSVNATTHTWVSALHCVEPGEMVAKMEATVVRSAPMQDLVLLRTRLGARALHLADHAPRVGDEVQIAGYPMGNESLLWGFGRVTATAYPFKRVGGFFLATSAGICGGHSGAPIMDKHGDVISVADFAPREGQPCGPLAFGPTYEALKAFVGEDWEH